MKLNSPTQQLGAQAEALAETKLKAAGLRFIARNFQASGGEIDLIMRDKDIFVFIEVRERCNPDFGSAVETVTFGKQKKIIKAAKAYLQKHHLWDRVACRFDVVGVNFNNPGEIDWIKDAFYLRGF